MPGRPLPANGFHADKPEFSAYARCLSLEYHASSIRRDGLSTLVCARILGYLLRYAPTNEGLVYVASEINHCADDSALILLAEKYSKHFIRCCK